MIESFATNLLVPTVINKVGVDSVKSTKYLKPTNKPIFEHVISD